MPLHDELFGSDSKSTRKLTESNILLAQANQALADSNMALVNTNNEIIRQLQIANEISIEHFRLARVGVLHHMGEFTRPAYLSENPNDLELIKEMKKKIYKNV